MTEGYHSTRNDLINLKQKHDSFVGIDSDGCVFDTMELKQKKCFHGMIASHWHLEPIEKYVRECAEFVNLYSKWRGNNRFPALCKVFDFLSRHPAVVKSGLPLPKLEATRKWIDSGAALGNPGLEKLVKETGNPELASLLKWSNDVNALIEENVRKVPPFKWVVESLELMSAGSDIICVSQTPGEALVREWAENGLTKYLALIAGQELGTKTEHLALATKGKYRPERVLMIGDAMGDKKAAHANNVLFYPINPGRENSSWERFYRESYAKFINCTYAGTYEQELIREFDSLLPDTPPWERLS